MILDLNNLIISPKLEIRFVYVPKCACTGWKMLMSDAEGGQYSRPGEVHVKQKAKYLSIVNSGSDFFKAYADFPLYTMIRDPLERLVSAYVDKIARNNLDAVGNYWRNLRQEYHEFLNGQGCSFEAFLEWICSEATPKRYSNDEHWRPFSKIIGDTSQYEFVFLMSDLDARISNRNLPQKARSLLDLFPTKTKSAPHSANANTNFSSVQLTETCVNLFNENYGEDIEVYTKLQAMQS